MRRGDKLRNRFGPPITSMGMAMAYAVMQHTERTTKEEYARQHDGNKVPRRKKGAGNGD